MCIKKIIAFTGIRSDYDLMSLIYKEMNIRSTFKIGLIVSGAHLSETYGYTINQIEADEIPIIAKIENLIDSNSKSSRITSLSILLNNCIHDVTRFDPDAIIVAGDREEVIVGALIGAYLNIPVIHFFGGDHAADGNVDNRIRHATSKLSNIHFVSNDQAKTRLLRMGEEDFRIFNLGSPSLDKFESTRYIKKEDILKNMGKEKFGKYAILVFHPILGEEKNSANYFEQIIYSLKNKSIKTFISYPNVDSGNKDIIGIIDKYKNDEMFCFYKNLDRDVFINLLRNCEFVIGNSSLGIYEAPLIKKGAINVGNRQKDRLSCENVIFVDQKIESIEKAIDEVRSLKFKNKLKNIKSLYGDGHSVKKIVDCIENIDFNKFIKKSNDVLNMR